MGFNKIEKIEGIAHLIKLNVLNLEGNLINSLQGVDGNRELK